MSHNFDPPVGVSAAAREAGDIPEIRISAADRPPGNRRAEEPQAGSAPVETRTKLLQRAGRIGATIATYSLAGLAGWGLYGLVAPHSAGWSDFIAAKFAQLSAPPVDLVPVTQKMQAEIEALHKKVEALEKARSASAKSLASLEAMNRRTDEAKSETKAEIDALSSRVALFQQETNTKFAELSAARPAKKRNAEPVETKAAPAAQKERQRQAARRNDAFDPLQHPTAPGVPRPLGAP
ncbi:MAG: hypothetical protein WBS22_15990 [Methylocystis sp.]